MAEIGYTPYLARLRHLGFEVLFERDPRVSQWSERVAKRPSVVEGVERWFNPKYLALFEESVQELSAECHGWLSPDPRLIEGGSVLGVFL